MKEPTPFDPAYMQAIFDLGYKMGREGIPWAKQPPKLAKQRHLRGNHDRKKYLAGHRLGALIAFGSAQPRPRKASALSCRTMAVRSRPPGPMPMGPTPIPGSGSPMSAPRPSTSITTVREEWWRCRRVQVVDRQTGRTLVLGYNAKMPLIIPGTTFSAYRRPSSTNCARRAAPAWG